MNGKVIPLSALLQTDYHKLANLYSLYSGQVVNALECTLRPHNENLRKTVRYVVIYTSLYARPENNLTLLYWQ